MPKPRRTGDGTLAAAQTARSEGREAWIDELMDALIAVFPDHRSAFELMRLDLRARNEEYTGRLNAVDRAVIDRVTTIVENYRLDTNDEIQKLWDAIRPLLERHERETGA